MRPANLIVAPVTEPVLHFMPLDAPLRLVSVLEPGVTLGLMGLVSLVQDVSKPINAADSNASFFILKRFGFRFRF